MRPRLGSYVGRVWLFGLCTAVAFECLGCNTSRYGASYDQRLPGIRHIHILPTQVQIESIHAGGMLEARPDVTAEVRPRLFSELQQAIRDKDRAVSLGNYTEAHTGEVKSIPQSLALANAIEQSILTHHYRYGKERVFEYTIGETVGELSHDGADTMLLVRLVGTVPTASRVGLAVTAAIVGGLTGIQSHVQTHYAELKLMLVDAETGEVLWYNIVVNEADVRNKRVLRNLVKSATKYMLELRKE